MRGRPKGSKNKTKIIPTEQTTQEPLIKRGRGRPKGSKGKQKIPQRTEQAVPLDIKEIKRQIRALGKCKRDTPKKTEERREINEKIRELKRQLIPVMPESLTPEKEALINEILELNKKYRPYLCTIMTVTSYIQYSIEQLQKHIRLFNSRRY